MVTVDLPRAAGEIRREDVLLLVDVLERLRSTSRVWLVRAHRCPCPGCAAAPGEPCWHRGRPYRRNGRRAHHTRRQDLAIRTYNEATPEAWRDASRCWPPAKLIAEIRRTRLFALALADGRVEHVLPTTTPVITTWERSEVLA